MTYHDEEQMTLGQLIAALKVCEQTANVYFEFGYFFPTVVDSYRGFYEDLAIGYSEDGYTNRPTVADLLLKLEMALNNDFTGYKGGTYTMHEDTPVWVANYGDSPSVAVVGVKNMRHQVHLKTKFVDLWG